MQKWKAFFIGKKIKHKYFCTFKKWFTFVLDMTEQITTFKNHYTLGNHHFHCNIQRENIQKKVDAKDPNDESRNYFIGYPECDKVNFLFQYQYRFYIITYYECHHFGSHLDYKEEIYRQVVSLCHKKYKKSPAINITRGCKLWDYSYRKKEKRMHAYEGIVEEVGYAYENIAKEFGFNVSYMLPEAIILHNSHYYEEMEAIREYLKSSKSLRYLERELENLISINYATLLRHAFDTLKKTKCKSNRSRRSESAL